MKRGNKGLLSVICCMIAGMILLAVAGACAEEDLTPVLSFSVNGSGYGNAEATYAVIPSSFEPGEGMTFTGGSFDAKPNNDYLLWETYGTAPAWTVEQVSGTPVSFETEAFVANEGSWREILVRLNETPQTAQDLVFNVTCDWEGHVSTQAFTMHFVEAQLPEGVTVPDMIDMQVGVEQALTFDFSPSLSWDDDRTRCFLNIMNNEEGFFSSDSYDVISSWENTFTPLRAGNAVVSAEVYYANLRIRKTCILRIADENGNVDNNIPEPVAINTANFPDDTFRHAVQEAFDRDGNQVLSSAELLATNWLSIEGVHTLSLKGIEHLPFLKSLYCARTRLLDADLSGNPHLRELYCGGCGLTSLNVSHNPELETLDCSWNQLRSLDVSRNPGLASLNCSGNGSLTSLDVRQNPYLNYLSCISCGLTSLDVSQNPLLNSLYCYDNELSALDVSRNTELSSLSCYENKLTSLDLSHNPALSWLDCYHNGFSALDVTLNEYLSAAVQENERITHYSNDDIGYALRFDRDVTVTAGEIVSRPLVTGNGTQGERAPVVEIPESITLGQNLAGTVTVSDEANETLYYLYYMNGSAPECQYATWLYDSGEQTTLIEYSHDRLTQPGTYRLMVVSDFGENVQEITVRSFTVTGTRPQAPQATAEVTEGYKNDTFTFRLTLAEGGDLLARKVRGTEVEYYYNRTSRTDYSWNITLGEAGDYAFSFAVKTGEIWSEYSAPVQVHVTSLGQLDAPENVFVPATLKAGEPLFLVAEESAGTDEYVVTIRGNDFYETRYPDGAAGAHMLVDYGLDAGEYTVEIVARGSRYEDSLPVIRPLTVTGGRPEGAEITVPDGQHYYYTTYWLTIRGDGVNAAVWYNGNGNVFLSDGTAVRLPVARYPYQEDISVRVQIGGCWSDIIPVRMEADYGSEDGELEIMSHPDSIQLGDGLPFRIELWEDAREYTYSVSFLTGDEEEGYYHEQVVYELVFAPDENGDAVIPAQYFRHAGLCEIGLNAYTDNYEGKYASFRVTVTENNNRPAAPTVTLLTADPVPYTDTQLQISAPGASRVCLVIQDVYEPSAVICNPQELELDANGDCTYIFNNKNISYSWSDQYLVSASAWNGAWSDYCEPVRIELEFDGDLPYMGESTVSFEPEEPMLGDAVTMYWEAVPGAEYYGIAMDGREKVFVPAEQTSYAYPAGDFEAGEHWVTVFAYAAGKQPASQDGRLTVSDPATRPVLTADKTTVRKNEAVTLNIRSVNGMYVVFYQNGIMQSFVQRDPSGDQNAVMRFAAPGTYTIQAGTSREIYYGGSPMSNPVVITVTEKEQLAAPELLSLEHGETIGQGASAAFSFPDGAPAKYIEFGSLDENGEFVPLVWTDAEATLSVEGYDLQEAGTYQFRAQTMAQYFWEEPSGDYLDSEWTTCNFTVGNAELQTLSFTLSAEEINYGESLDITVTPPAERYAVQRLRYDLNTDDDEGEGGFSLEDTVTSTCYMGPGRYVYRVSGLYNGLWSKIGEFSYRVLPVGYAALPTVTRNGEEVTEQVTAELTEQLAFAVSAERATGVSWEIYEQDVTGGFVYRSSGYMQGNEITIDLADDITEAGVYQLRIYGNLEEGWAYDGQRVITLTVEEAWAPVYPDAITPGQDVRIVIPEAEGAVSYSVHVYDGQFPTFSDITGPGEYMIPAAAFSEGGWFCIMTGASDGEYADYKWSEKEYSDVAPASGLSPLHASITTVVVQGGSPVSFSLSAGNPSRVLVQQWVPWADAGFPGTKGGDWFAMDDLKNGGSSFDDFQYLSDAPHIFRFAALVNGKWTAWSNAAISGGEILNLPADLTTIESEAFANLPKAVAVRIPGTVSSIAVSAFDEGIFILAPAGSYAIEWAENYNRNYFAE